MLWLRAQNYEHRLSESNFLTKEKDHFHLGVPFHFQPVVYITVLVGIVQNILSVWMFELIEYIEKIKVPIKTNNWDADSYRNKLDDVSLFAKKINENNKK